VKSISTESKVFSIYGVGVVKGYKRETRVRIHSVVDFRGAPTLADLGSAIGAAAPAASSGSAGGQTAPPTNAQADANALAVALQPNVGGEVLYFNIE
jgi:general secretion pathway protein K